MLIPDLETEIDYLNCESISQSVVELLRFGRERPITVGIHGDWGAGKSSVLKMIENELSSDDEVVVLWFNGWAFEGFEDAKSVFIENTIAELCRKRSNVEGIKEKGKELLKRVSWLKLARQGGSLAFNVISGLPSPDQIQGVMGYLRNLKTSFTDLDSSEFSERVEQMTSLLKPAEGSETVPESIHRFRLEFQELLNEAKIKQFVVLIDDLDRCLPITAIQTLEAIRLFLFVPKSAFVIGADEAMIEYAVRQHFPELPLTSSPLSYARNYLEKLIQIPFRIPALGAQETRTYVILVLVQTILGAEHGGFQKLLKEAKESLKQPWKGKSLSQISVQNADEGEKERLSAAYLLAQQVAPILAEGTRGNPRQIKRFLNTILLRQVIAEARGFGKQLKQPVLAKLMLAERFQPEFYDYLATQAMATNDGKIETLAVLESKESTKKSKVIPKRTSQNRKKEPISADTDKITEWRENEWLKDWFGLEPKLGNVDLRPYVFVARDKRLISNDVIQDRIDLLITSLCGNQLAIREVETEVQALSDSDAGVVFNALRERILSVGTFDTEPQGIHGLAIVAKHHPRLQMELVALIESMDSSQLGLWVLKGWNETISEPQARRKLINVMRNWERQDSNNSLKVAASSAIATLEKSES